jgi:hypothetical protein
LGDKFIQDFQNQVLDGEQLTSIKSKFCEPQTDTKKCLELIDTTLDRLKPNKKLSDCTAHHGERFWIFETYQEYTIPNNCAVTYDYDYLVIMGLGNAYNDITESH